VSLIIVNVGNSGNAMPAAASAREATIPTRWAAPGHDLSGHIAAGVRPTEAQRRYLVRGLTRSGGKLPLFDKDGREISGKMMEFCTANG
jgi:hypothetical protein